MTTTCIDEFLAAVEAASIEACDAWSTDVVLDATVPDWRFQRRGPDALKDEYARWFAAPGRFEAIRREPLAHGEIIEYVLTWPEGGDTFTAHHVHIIDVRDGRIVHDTVMCGGRWSSELRSQMETASGA